MLLASNLSQIRLVMRVIIVNTQVVPRAMDTV